MVSLGFYLNLSYEEILQQGLQGFQEHKILVW